MISHITPVGNTTIGLAELQRSLDSARTSQTALTILDVALSLFLEFGLRRTTMEDVAKRANIGRITIYRHFEDKNALFQTVVLREVQRAIAQVEQHLAAIESAEQRFVEGFVMVVNGARRHPLSSRLLETEPEWFLPHLTVNGTAILTIGCQYVSSFLSQDATRGLLRDDLPVALFAEMLWRLLHSIMLTPGGQLAPRDGNDDALRDIARHFLLPLLARETRARMTSDDPRP